MVKLERLKSIKFKPLDRAQLDTIKGGQATGGGSVVIGQYQVQQPFEQDANGKTTVGWRTVTVTRIRSWSADDISGGTTCYEGEEICDQ